MAIQKGKRKARRCRKRDAYSTNYLKQSKCSVRKQGIQPAREINCKSIGCHVQVTSKPHPWSNLRKKYATPKNVCELQAHYTSGSILHLKKNLWNYQTE